MKKIKSFKAAKLVQRLKVIENIESALQDGDTFRKVETGDPVITSEMVKKVILPFDNLRRKPLSKLKFRLAILIAEKFTAAFKDETVLSGVENALNVKGGAIITANHYNPKDTTPVRMLAQIMGKGKKHNIVVQESNIFMKGVFGFLMRNCGTLPVSKSPEYMAKNLKPALKKLLSEGHLVLIYPEQEMWFNYKKPRPLRDGAYHYAALFGVPVIPTFTEMQNMEGETDDDGFYKVRRILHIMPPIYPDHLLSVRENRERMRKMDMEYKINAYKEAYGYYPPEDFLAERDIAGYPDL